MSSRYVVTLPGQDPSTAEIHEHEHAYEIEYNGKTYIVDVRGQPGSPTRSLIIDGLAYEAATSETSDGMDVFISGDAFHVDVVDELWSRAAAGSKEKEGYEEIASPMPGAVVKVLVNAGDMVNPGDAVVVVEAMKMQNELAAEHGGKITAVNVSEGDVVEQGQILLIVEDPTVSPTHE